MNGQPIHTQSHVKVIHFQWNQVCFKKKTPFTKTLQPFKIVLRRICSLRGVVTTNLFFNGANSRSICNANVELTNDLLDLE